MTENNILNIQMSEMELLRTIRATTTEKIRVLEEQRILDVMALKTWKKDYEEQVQRTNDAEMKIYELEYKLQQATEVLEFYGQGKHFKTIARKSSFGALDYEKLNDRGEKALEILEIIKNR